MARFELICRNCRHSFERIGISEDDTNATIIEDDRGEDCPKCGSENTDVVCELDPDYD